MLVSQFSINYQNYKSQDEGRGASQFKGFFADFLHQLRILFRKVIPKRCDLSKELGPNSDKCEIVMSALPAEQNRQHGPRLI